jgi:dihydroorotase (multifunctional complex type)
VHTRDPGYTAKEDITSASVQAAAGGVTTIFGMPNVLPPTTTVQALEDVLELYAAKCIVDYNHNPGVVEADQISAMADRGVRAFKLFMIEDTQRDYPHQPGLALHGNGAILKVMDLISKTSARLIVHPHDQSLMDYFEGPYLERGEDTPQAYAQAYAAREGALADTACDSIIRLAEASQCRVNIAHMQSRRAVEAVRRAKRAGIPVTCEINHWALFLGRWEDIEKLGPFALSLWVPDDARAAIWEGIADGTIDVCGSDHAPHLREEKETGWTKMWSSPGGTPGIQYFYPLLLDAAHNGQLSYGRAVELAAETPARAFGLEGVKGSLTVGCDADIVIASTDSPWIIKEEDVMAKCGWTPYEGRQLTVKIEHTYVRGREVYSNGKVLGKPGDGRMALARTGGRR